MAKFYEEPRTIIDFIDENKQFHSYVSFNPDRIGAISELILNMRKHSEDPNYPLSREAYNEVLRLLDNKHKSEGGLAKVLLKGMKNYFDNSSQE